MTTTTTNGQFKIRHWLFIALLAVVAYFVTVGKGGFWPIAFLVVAAIAFARAVIMKKKLAWALTVLAIFAGMIWPANGWNATKAGWAQTFPKAVAVVEQVKETVEPVLPGEPAGSTPEFAMTKYGEGVPEGCVAMPTTFDQSGQPDSIEMTYGTGVKYVHLDYHQPGGESVSVLLTVDLAHPELPGQAHSPVYLSGFGFRVVFPENGCEKLTFPRLENDTKRYIDDRQAANKAFHTGLIFRWEDWLAGKDPIYNKDNLPKDRWPTPLMATKSSTNSLMAGAITIGACPEAKFTRYTSPTDFTVVGPAVVQPYVDGKPQYRFQVDSGKSYNFVGVKGDVYKYEDNAMCIANLPAQFAKGEGAYDAITYAGLKTLGWVK